MSDWSVAVVVVTFGHPAQLTATLRSITAQHYPTEQLQLILVENGSGESAAVARAIVPDALVLEPGTNLGFARGCNLGVEQGSASVVALINPDVVLAPHFLRALVKALEDASAGIVGAKLFFPDGVTLQHAGGELIMPLGLTAHRGHGEPDSPTYDEGADVAYVTGAALAARRETWTHLGGFDETFGPAYYEEVDLCLRARAAGLRVRYIPEAVATHRETSALGQKSVAYYRLYHANRLRLLFKHQDDRWLAREWLPAELRHLRTTADDNDVDGLTWAYRTWQAHFLAGNTLPDARLDNWQDPPGEQGPPPGSEMAWTLGQASSKQVVTPRPFQSRLPGLALLRGWWNRLATEEYLRPIIQQQNDLNATLVELTTALERQRRTTDGAVLCQGMFLAKVLAGKSPATDSR